MWAAQLALALFGWVRANSMTVSGFRIHWDNARFRDLVLVLRVVAGGILIVWALPSFPEPYAVLYSIGVVVSFFVPAVSETPVVMMKRWSVEPPTKSRSSNSSSSEKKGRRGRDL